MSASVIVSKKPAGEFKIGEAAYFGMRSFGDDGRESYKDIKILVKKGRKWAYWGFRNGKDFDIIKKTLLTEMMCVAPPEEEEEGEEEEEEEVESWVCSECCGYWHATQAQYDERPCCEKCWENSK
jgi:hypothetical protein